MRLFANLILSFVLSGPVAAENMSGPYLVAAAVLEGNFDFAGDANAQDEEGSGNFLAVGYRWSDRLSTELAYTDANDYKNQQFGTSKVDMWEVAALIHGGYAGQFDPYFRLTRIGPNFVKIGPKVFAAIHRKGCYGGWGSPTD